MAESGGQTAVCNNILVDNRCRKHNKVVRNGILFDNCDKWYHFNKCSNVKEDKIPDNQWLCPSCSLRNTPENEIMTMQYVNREVLCKLLEEVSSLREMTSILKSERVQEVRSLVHYENENSWSQVVKGKSRRRNQVSPQFSVSTSNRFFTLNDVADETLQKKTFSCQKKNVKKKNKLMFYSDSHGRGIRTLLSKSNDDVSVFGEVRPGAKVKDVLKNCVKDCAVLSPQDHVIIMGGANDTARNETKTCINVVKRTLSALTCTNVVLNIPIRHDLINESVVNKEIRKANMDINKVCKRFRNSQ
jgi:hypothetical protein